MASQVSFSGGFFGIDDYIKQFTCSWIIIRQIKTYNIGNAAVIQKPFVQLFDFGITNYGDTYGLSLLTAEGLLFGTKNYTKKEIEESLDFIGASYKTSSSKEFAEISMSFVNTDQETVFPILKDIVIW